MRTLRRLAGLLLVLGVLGYVAGCAVLGFNQEYLVFHPGPWKGLGQGLPPTSRGFRYEDVRIKTSDGLTIGGWLTAADAPDPMTVLFFHGKGCNVTALGDF